MSDEISIPIELPLDSDGFLRRECPTCGGQFKWRSDEAETSDNTPVEQYFCPLCGVAAGLDQWWTPEQLDYAEASAASSPEVDTLIQDLIGDSLKVAMVTNSTTMAKSDFYFPAGTWCELLNRGGCITGPTYQRMNTKDISQNLMYVPSGKILLVNFWAYS